MRGDAGAVQLTPPIWLRVFTPNGYLLYVPLSGGMCFVYDPLISQVHCDGPRPARVVQVTRAVQVRLR